VAHAVAPRFHGKKSVGLLLPAIADGAFDDDEPSPALGAMPPNNKIGDAFAPPTITECDREAYDREAYGREVCGREVCGLDPMYDRDALTACEISLLAVAGGRFPPPASL
jgi:hypothetical protein